MSRPRVVSINDDALRAGQEAIEFLGERVESGNLSGVFLMVRDRQGEYEYLESWCDTEQLVGSLIFALRALLNESAGV